MELWDAYNADGTKAGFELIKGQRIPDGIYRAVCYVTVRHADGTYLLIKNAFTGESFADTDVYECSAFGAVLKGENSYGAAVRRLKETTGIVAKSLELINFEIIKTENIMLYGYLCEVEHSKADEELFGAGVTEYRWESEDGIYAELKSERCKIAYRERLLPYFAQRKRVARLNDDR